NASFFDGYVMPFFNARRNAVFTALYRFEAGQLKEVIEEQYVPLVDWFEKLAEFADERIVCLSPHIDVYDEVIRENLGERVLIPDSYAHLLRPVHLIEASVHSEAVATHDVKPNYLRVTEAEAKLLKGNKK